MIKSDAEIVALFSKCLDDVREMIPEPLATDLIAQLQSKWQVSFPVSYAAFLRMVGWNAESVFVGDDVGLESLDDLQQQARGWATENRIELGADPVFFFYGHHGYEFAFFRDDGTADPPAFVVSDSYHVPEIVDENLSGALFQLVERAEYESTFRRNRRPKK